MTAEFSRTHGWGATSVQSNGLSADVFTGDVTVSRFYPSFNPDRRARAGSLGMKAHRNLPERTEVRFERAARSDRARRRRGAGRHDVAGDEAVTSLAQIVG